MAREQPNFEAAEGSFVFTLGTSAEGDFQTLNDNDNIKVEQTADFTGIQNVHFDAFIRSIDSMPGTKKWRFQWGVGATVQAWRDLRPGARFFRMRDGVIDTSQLGGNGTIFFQLILLAS